MHHQLSPGKRNETVATCGTTISGIYFFVFVWGVCSPETARWVGNFSLSHNQVSVLETAAFGINPFLFFPDRAAGTAAGRRTRRAPAVTWLGIAAPSANTRIGRTTTELAGQPPPPATTPRHRLRRASKAPSHLPGLLDPAMRPSQRSKTELGAREKTQKSSDPKKYFVKKKTRSHWNRDGGRNWTDVSDHHAVGQTAIQKRWYRRPSRCSF